MQVSTTQHPSASAGVPLRRKPWILAVLLEWQWISMAMALSLAGTTHATAWPLRVACFAAGAAATGLLMRRLLPLGLQAARGEASRRPWLNDALGVYFVWWPLLLSLRAVRQPGIAAGVPPGRPAAAACAGVAAPAALAWMARLSAPRMLLPPRRVRDIAAAALQVAGRLAATAFFAWLYTRPVGYGDWPLVLAMWYAGSLTTLWAGAGPAAAFGVRTAAAG